jgi:hypothetical protein
MRFWLLNWYIEVNLRSRHKWSHFRIHRQQDLYSYRHLVWGRLSLIWWQPQNETQTCCGECDSLEPLGGVSYGDEGWNVCESCRAIEGKTKDVSYWELIQNGVY